MEELSLLAIPAKISLRRSARAKRSRIMIRRAGLVEVVAPLKLSHNRIQSFVNEFRPWIIKTLSQLEKKSTLKIWPETFSEGAEILYRGKAWPIHRHLDPARPIHIHAQGHSFHLSLPRDDTPFATIKKAFIAWFKIEFARDLNVFLERYAPKLPKKSTAIRIRPYRSLWGSCHSDGTIRLNFYLNFVPSECFEYVVVHELCHLIQMNHSKAFWAHVTQLLPDYRDRQKLLKNYTSLLDPVDSAHLL